MNLATQTLPSILGGSKAVTLDQKEAMRWPLITPDDEQAVIQVLRDGDLSLHRVTRVLEEDYRTKREIQLQGVGGRTVLLVTPPSSPRPAISRPLRRAHPAAPSPAVRTR